MMLIATGCAQCDGPTDALYRVWRNDGETHAERLVDAGLSDYEHAYITGYALRPDLSDIVVSICVAGQCTGAGNMSPDAEMAFFRSHDGGITWQLLMTTEPGEITLPVAIADQGLVLQDRHVHRRYHVRLLRGRPDRAAGGCQHSGLRLPIRRCAALAD